MQAPTAGPRHFSETSGLLTPFPRSVPSRRSQPSSQLALGLPSYLPSRLSHLCPPGPARWRPAGGRCRNHPGQGEPRRWSSSSVKCSCRSRWWRRHRRSARGTGSRCARHPARPTSRGNTRRWPAPPQPAVRPAAAAGVKWRSGRRRRTCGVRPTWHPGARAALLQKAQCRLQVNRGLRNPGTSGAQTETSLLSVSSAALSAQATALCRDVWEPTTPGCRVRRLLSHPSLSQRMARSGRGRLASTPALMELFGCRLQRACGAAFPNPLETTPARGLSPCIPGEDPSCRITAEDAPADTEPGRCHKV